MRRLLFVPGLLLAVGWSHVTQAQLAAQVAAVAADELERSGAPSLQIAISRHGGVLYEGAFGLSDVENQVAAGSASRYRTASVAKWFTATAAMRLAEAGKLDLDRPIDQYCPEFPRKRWPITTRQLLNHTAGIRGYIDDDVNHLHLRYTDVVAPLSLFSDSPLSFEPGSQWEYTSFGYQLLGCVLQGAAEMPYRELMAALIFEPADMAATTDDDAWQIIPGRVQGYRLERGGALRRADYRDVSGNLPAGGYLSTATDLAMFAHAYHNELLSERSRTLMQTPLLLPTTQISEEKSWRDAIPTEGQYGYGLMMFSKYGVGLIGHTGRQAGASAILVSSPEEGLVVAVMSNVKGWNGYLPFSLKLLELARGTQAPE